MYVWNGFTIVGKRADYTESLLVTIEKAEQQLRNDTSELNNSLLLETSSNGTIIHGNRKYIMFCRK